MREGHAPNSTVREQQQRHFARSPVASRVRRKLVCSLSLSLSSATAGWTRHRRRADRARGSTTDCARPATAIAQSDSSSPARRDQLDCGKPSTARDTMQADHPTPPAPAFGGSEQRQRPEHQRMADRRYRDRRQRPGSQRLQQVHARPGWRCSPASATIAPRNTGRHSSRAPVPLGGREEPVLERLACDERLPSTSATISASADHQRPVESAGRMAAQGFPLSREESVRQWSARDQACAESRSASSGATRSARRAWLCVMCADDRPL